MLACDVTLQDGETIGFSADDKQTITRSPGVSLPEEQMTLKIGYEPVSYTHLDVYKRQMEECLHDVEQAAYHPHKALNQAIAQHLMQGDLQENLDRL